MHRIQLETFVFKFEYHYAIYMMSLDVTCDNRVFLVVFLCWTLHVPLHKTT